MHQGTFSVTNFHNRISCIQHGMFRTLVLNGAMRKEALQHVRTTCFSLFNRVIRMHSLQKRLP